MQGVRVVRGAAVLAALACTPAWGAHAKQVTVQARVRAAPQGSSAVLGTARVGQAFAAIGKSGDWWLIQFDARRAWIKAAALGRSGDDVRRVSADRLTVRAGAGDRFRALGELPRGALVVVQARVGSWRQISFGGRQAYVHAQHLSARATTGVLLEVKVDGATLRAGAGAATRELGALKRGRRVRVTERQGGWSRIALSGRDGWTRSDYLGELGAGQQPPRPRSSRGFVQLAASGPGFASYAAESGRWGTPRMVYGLERIGRRWQGGGRPVMRVGDISLAGGGPMPGHASHQLGVDVDVSPVRNDGRALPVTIFESSYSRALTRRLLGLFVSELPIQLIFFNDDAAGPVQRWPNHDNHFHARIR
ncbi:MAG: penicillin-insensitive murein endopeptidase [Planctomycetes bacterium]|nr:penicillin-insensitive murein endopeptidase [Planctomycetota bacterium]